MKSITMEVGTTLVLFLEYPCFLEEVQKELVGGGDSSLHHFLPKVLSIQHDYVILHS